MMMGWLLGWRQSIVLAIYGLADRNSGKIAGLGHLATEPVHRSPYLWTGSQGARYLWLSHVALEAQCDVAGAFLPFSGLKEGFLPQPCRVGDPIRRGSLPTRRDGPLFALFRAKMEFPAEPLRVGAPMRRGSPPTRRGGGFFALFQAKRGSSATAMSRWRPNATWRSTNTTWRALFRPFPG